MTKQFQSAEHRRLPLSGSRYYLSENGEVFDKATNVYLPVETVDGEDKILIDWVDGFRYYRRWDLIGFASLPTHLPHAYWSQVRCLPKDGDAKNFQTENLVWKYPIGLGREHHNGFAFIPLYSRYMVNSEGAVFERTSKKLLTLHRSKDYWQYSVLSDSGARTCLKRHRAIALAFLDYPLNVVDMEVNHKDGVAGKDDLENLEWVTSSQNRQHAVDNGLTAVNKPIVMTDQTSGETTEFNSIKSFCSRHGLSRHVVAKKLSDSEKSWIFEECLVRYKNPDHYGTVANRRPVLVRNARTGVEKEYASIAECVRELSVSKDVVDSRITAPKTALYKNGLQFKFKDDLEEWYIPKNFEQELLNYSWEKVVLVRVCSTGLVEEYQTQRAAANALGVREPTIHEWLSDSNQRIRFSPLVGLIQLIKKSEFCVWRIPDNPEVEYENSSVSKGVFVKNEDTGEVVEYTSAFECSKAHNLLPSTLNWRLKFLGEKAYEGFRFKYKKDGCFKN